MAEEGKNADKYVQSTNGSSTMGGLESTRDRADEISPQTTIRVRKRNGSTEPVDVNKIVRAVSRCCSGLCDVDALRIATKTISGLYNGATTRELDLLSIQTAASLIVEELQYSKLAASLLAASIDKEVRGHEIYAFSQSVAFARDSGLAIERLASFVANNARNLNNAIDSSRDREFEYFGLRTLYDRYLLKHPTKRLVIETTTQQFFLRIACALSETVAQALDLYDLFSSLAYLPSSPTLFNAGTRYEQLSSCFLVDSPRRITLNISINAIATLRCCRSFPVVSGLPITVFARVAL